MAAQFTPGPWREGIDGNNRVYGPDCAGEHTGLIAVVYKGRANISLIAAAPDLYEALSQIREHSSLSHASAAMIDAALAKANGERVQA